MFALSSPMARWSDMKCAPGNNPCLFVVGVYLSWVDLFFREKMNFVVLNSSLLCKKIHNFEAKKCLLVLFAWINDLEKWRFFIQLMFTSHCFRKCPYHWSETISHKDLLISSKYSFCGQMEATNDEFSFSENAISTMWI